MKRTVTFSEPVDFSDLNIVGYICDHFSTRLNGIYNKGLVILRHIDADILHIYLSSYEPEPNTYAYFSYLSLIELWL